ncbi:MAG: ATP-dependent DNA helicase [Rhodospirillales bacterium]|nr:ATP-dependent DNA helicase [Rhodospirillales bacterium]
MTQTIPIETADSERSAPLASSPLMPDVPVLCAGARQAALLTTDGEIRLVDRDDVRGVIGSAPVLVCHAPQTRTRLGLDLAAAFDVLELFAFVHPGQFCVPTVSGLARALGLSAPETLSDYPLSLYESARNLLADLRKDSLTTKADPLQIAAVMGLNGKGWPWTPYVFATFGRTYDPAEPLSSRAALAVWKHMPEWAERAPPPPPGHHPVTEEESRARLKKMLGGRGGASESRLSQRDYASKVASAFAAVDEPGHPHVVLAEAGTGTGKTLGYLAPATVWAEKNEGAVWISTYTRNLQRQIESELHRLYPDPVLRDSKVVVRKGRENYLCLLNFEDMAAGAGLARTRAHAVAAGLMARWIAATRDGDFTGPDFPAWLAGLLGRGWTTALSDRRGECLHSACEHYHRCFIERAVRKSRHAGIVVANHALVMTQTAQAGADALLPTRYVFDEGHHVFDAADSVFATHLSGLESVELRIWLLGREASRARRAKGLKWRIEDLVGSDQTAGQALDDVLQAAQALPSDGWARRIPAAAGVGSGEAFLAQVFRQVMARDANAEGFYSLETGLFPPTPDLLEAARTFGRDLRALHKPMKILAARFLSLLADGAETLSEDTKKRLTTTAQGLDRRAQTVGVWIEMLESVESGKTPAGLVDWLAIERVEGGMVDAGFYRHWIDPGAAFAAAIRSQAQGMAFTSATLCDSSGDVDADWRTASLRTGSHGLTDSPVTLSVPSPFDYAALTRVFVVKDLNRENPDEIAAAFRSLFEISGGGGMGLFTAITRLRAVHSRIAEPLEEKAIPLYAQHVDDMDTGTLVDIFRDDRHACLLGTDALRDGVDVPGDSLRLIVFDRVPWPRPDILHKARREAFGKGSFDDSITRLKLKQAYGRLIRRSTDRGAFVMLDSRFPSRLSNAFPDGVQVERLSLPDVLAELRRFFSGVEGRAM